MVCCRRPGAHAQPGQRNQAADDRRPQQSVFRSSPTWVFHNSPTCCCQQFFDRIANRPSTTCDGRASPRPNRQPPVWSRNHSWSSPARSVTRGVRSASCPSRLLSTTVSAEPNRRPSGKSRAAPPGGIAAPIETCAEIPVDTDRTVQQARSTAWLAPLKSSTYWPPGDRSSDTTSTAMIRIGPAGREVVWLAGGCDAPGEDGEREGLMGTGDELAVGKLAGDVPGAGVGLRWPASSLHPGASNAPAVSSSAPANPRPAMT